MKPSICCSRQKDYSTLRLANMAGWHGHFYMTILPHEQGGFHHVSESEWQGSPLCLTWIWMDLNLGCLSSGSQDPWICARPGPSLSSVCIASGFEANYKHDDTCFMPKAPVLRDHKGSMFKFNVCVPGSSPENPETKPQWTRVSISITRRWFIVIPYCILYKLYI